MANKKLFSITIIFINLLLNQSVVSETLDIPLVNKLLQKKQFAKLEQLKKQTNSDVFTRWLEYETILNDIEQQIQSLKTKNRFEKFIRNYPSHEFTKKLIKAYFKKLHETTKNSSLIKNRAKSLLGRRKSITRGDSGFSLGKQIFFENA